MGLPALVSYTGFRPFWFCVHYSSISLVWISFIFTCFSSLSSENSDYIAFLLFSLISFFRWSFDSPWPVARRRLSGRWCRRYDRLADCGTNVDPAWSRGQLLGDVLVVADVGVTTASLTAVQTSTPPGAVVVLGAVEGAADVVLHHATTTSGPIRLHQVHDWNTHTHTTHVNTQFRHFHWVCCCFSSSFFSFFKSLSWNSDRPKIIMNHSCIALFSSKNY